jgi:hypothetical protein
LELLWIQCGGRRRDERKKSPEAEMLEAIKFARRTHQKPNINKCVYDSFM